MPQDPTSTRSEARALTDHSRRTLLKAAAAGSAAVAVMGAARVIGADAGDATLLNPADDGRTVVAYLSDARVGEVTVMVGANEVVRRDARLAARLLEIAREVTDVVPS